MELLDFKTFEPKLGKWAPRFKPFIESKEMWDILQKLKSEGKVVVPKSSDTFRAFSTTDPDNLKVIFYLMDPYPRQYKDGTLQANGIAMDCSNSPDGKLQPSLIKWYDAIDKELGREVKRSPSLEYLHEQGVMLLNTDLTCKLNKTQSHEGLWEPFQKYFLEEVVGSDTQIIYVLCGKASHKMEKYINPFCRIIKLAYPAAAEYSKGEWDSKGVFNQINSILKDNNGSFIFWDKDLWESSKDLPF